VRKDSSSRLPASPEQISGFTWWSLCLCRMGAAEHLHHYGYVQCTDTQASWKDNGSDAQSSQPAAAPGILTVQSAALCYHPPLDHCSKDAGEPESLCSRKRTRASSVWSSEITLLWELLKAGVDRTPKLLCFLSGAIRAEIFAPLGIMAELGHLSPGNSKLRVLLRKDIWVIFKRISVGDVPSHIHFLS